MNTKIKIFFTKEELKALKMNRKRFYYIVRKDVAARGYNRTIKVFAYCKDGTPICLGWMDANTAAYVGDQGCAAQIVGKSFGYKHDNYKVFRKDVFIFELH